MQDLLHRLYKTKLTLLAVLLTVVGLGLLFLAHWAAGQPHWSWLRNLPVADIGLALFTTGLITVAWQYFAQEVADAHTVQLFRGVLKDEAPDIRDAVIQGFAFQADDLARVASPATMDEIVRNCLALQLGDRQLAEDVYADLRTQVIRSPERRHDMSVSVDLSPSEHGPAAGKGSMFVATIRWEYRVVSASPVMRFSCVSDLDEYHELLQDPTSSLAWYFEPVGKLTAASDEAFELVQFSVDGKAQPIRRTKRVKGQTFAVTIDHTGREDAAPASSSPREVTISYTYRVLVQRNGHSLYLNIGKLTKGMNIQFRYGGCGIRYVNVLDFIASAQQARISRTPESVPTPAIEIGFDGWVLPKSGAAFVWVLDSEMS